ncbi:MAG: DUF2970 domain-containing protein [Nevskiaceae bacterium]|nr:MAG: DUF2970 domain-containing protein [Nevskiaceae bacterium]TBR71932.1 MAG: DUF2970 domain-containing protein [Nevskiaceae bacterium]
MSDPSRDRDFPPRELSSVEEWKPGGIPPHQRLTFWQSVVAVLSALFGVRSREGFRRDLTYGNPVFFILIGFILFCLFIAALWIFVQFLLIYLIHREGL